MVFLADVVKEKSSGATPKKSEAKYYQGGNIPWIRTQDVDFNEIFSVDSYITQTAVDETAVKWIPENCVIVAISGASAGRCAVNKIRATTNQHCLNLQIKEEIALYQYIYFCVMNGYEELLRKKQGARGDLNSALILSTIIPLPTLVEQKQIVHLLDTFNRICTGISTGLPAEIEARQKQYEYYRDKLLDFRQKQG
ncbi:restriction endonuclease subunit S [Mitsuokella sp. AF33-22]|uniref:restriction endonuclease subunit S n=1 Tax=Mitsuokella sp. AF33-22 TaxID=2292047 RepID=UPI000E4EAB38|nr:restriction endonuclease subunit S [Mitsuokella sp. AF33-22]RHM54214.1 restriction endonuclease subunit S [Mitsuokella sp. AF33-22]